MGSEIPCLFFLRIRGVEGGVVAMLFEFMIERCNIL